MAKKSTQPLGDEEHCTLVQSPSRANSTERTTFSPSNTHDLPQKAPHTSRLSVSDFYSLVRSSSAAIACFDFPDGVLTSAQTHLAFSESLYRAPSLCLEASESFARMRGYATADHVVDKPLATLAPPKDGFQNLFAEWHRQRLTIEGLELRLNDAEGTHRVFHVALYATLHEKSITRIWMVLRDISTLTRAITAVTNAEHHYRSLLEHPELLYLRCYADGAVSYASSIARQELDISAATSTHLDEALGRACHPDDRGLLERLLYHRRALAREPLAITLRLIGRKGGLSSYSIIQHPHILGDEVDAYEIIATRTHNTSAALSDATMSAGLAHDANNQLLIATAAIERVRESIPEDHHSRSLLDSALRSIAHCASIHAQSINVSAGIEPNCQSIDIEELFADVMRQCEAILPDGIALYASVHQGPLAAWADPTHLNQVLINLILNARDALGSSGGITLNATRKGHASSDSPATQLRPVCISVSDNGPGLDSGVRDRLFQPFVSTKSRARTRGLGLTMVKALIERNGGEIAVTSARGMGTTFTVSLPEAQSPPTPPTQTIKKSAPAPSSSYAHISALIADDEPEVRQTLLASLIAQGAEASAVPDAISLVRELTRPNTTYNLVILDDGLLGSGAQHSRDLITARLAIIPVIVTSGNASLATQRAQSATTRFLAKPFSLADLLCSVDALCPPNESPRSGPLGPQVLRRERALPPPRRA
jgi:signal transduction histidine kinase/ActR/RegA family two-component response regulator